MKVGTWQKLMSVCTIVGLVGGLAGTAASVIPMMKPQAFEPTEMPTAFKNECRRIAAEEAKKKT